MKNFTKQYFRNVTSFPKKKSIIIVSLLITNLILVGCSKGEDARKDKLISALIVQNVMPKVDGIEFEELKLPEKQEDFFAVRVSPRARLRYTIRSITIWNTKLSTELVIRIFIKIL